MADLLKICTYLVLILSGTSANGLDYQDRCLYYSDKDSVCCGNSGMDDLEITLDIEDKGTRVLFSWGYTRCDSSTSSCAGRIFPGNQWLILQQGDHPFHPRTQIPIKQETKKITDLFGRLKQLIVRTRVEVNSTQETRIDYEPYRCVVMGDGEIHHFDRPDKKCKLYIKCDKLRKPQQLSE